MFSHDVTAAILVSQNNVTAAMLVSQTNPVILATILKTFYTDGVSVFSGFCYKSENGRNLSTRLTEHKRATRNVDVNNHIAEHHLQTKHQIDWDSATCMAYSTDYYQSLTLESWFTNLEQTPLNRSQQLPAPYKRLIDEIKQNY